MTDFQKKRLEYFIKAAEKGEYVQLGPGDVEFLTDLVRAHNFGFDNGFLEGIDYVLSGETDSDKEDSLKELLDKSKGI